MWGSHIFKSAYDFLAEQLKPKKMFEALTTKRGQLALLSKYLIKALDAENFEICGLAARALGLIGDQ
jgi:hypothetical protein